MPGLTPETAQKIHELLHNQQVLMAIQVYRSATGVSLADAKNAVEAMARDESVKPPAAVRDVDNPVLEARLRSLISKGQKIDAVKIHREEYGVGLQEARDAVERIEASMRSEGMFARQPSESAIGQDPFADENRISGRMILAIAAVLALGICGLAVLLFLGFSLT